MESAKCRADEWPQVDKWRQNQQAPPQQEATMNWDHSTAWWVATGVLVALELVTGTFYLLMVAIGTAAGALAAHAGLPFTGQLVTAAVIGGAGVALWHRRRLSQPAGPRAAENPDLNI